MNKILQKKKIQIRILEISYKYKLSHVSSCLTVLPILIDIYEKKAENDNVILSCGHAGLAQYVILEEIYGKQTHDAEKMLDNFGIHPLRDTARHIDVSTGSLGCGILIATGMALGNKDKNVYCVVSDGELREGSCYEALNFAQKINLTNFKVHVNVNGYSAYEKINIDHMLKVLNCYDCIERAWLTSNELCSYPFLYGFDAHYHVMTKEEHESTK